MSGSLEGTLPELQRKEQALHGYADSVGIGYEIADYGGRRTQADTTQLIKWRDDAVRKNGPKAYYPVAPFGTGYHGKGAAFDLKIVRVPAGKTIAWGYATLGAFAPKIGLRWGGHFPGRNVDPYHFELAITLAAAQQLFDAMHRAQATTPIPATVRTSQAPAPKDGALIASVSAITPARPGSAAMPLILIVGLAGIAALVVRRVVG